MEILCSRRKKVNDEYNVFGFLSVLIIIFIPVNNTSRYVGNNSMQMGRIFTLFIKPDTDESLFKKCQRLTDFEFNVYTDGQIVF